MGEISMSKVFTYRIIALWLIFVLTVCTSPTSQLWKDHYKSSFYGEVIDGLAVNPEDQSLIVVGEKYHYLFDRNEVLAYLLAHYNGKNMTFDLEHGRYEANEEQIKANFTVRIDVNQIGKENILWLNDHKVATNKDQNNYFNIHLSLKGKRYTADPVVNQVVQELSKQYKINIAEKQIDNLNDGTRILLTPLALVGDGVRVASVTVGVVAATGILAVVGATAITLRGICQK